MSVDLFQAEHDLRRIVFADRLAFPISESHDPAIPGEVRTHVKTVNERADNIEAIAEIVKIISADPVRWRVLFALPRQRFMDVVDQLRSA